MRHATRIAWQFGGEGEAIDEITAHDPARSHKHSCRSRCPCRPIASIFERLPRNLQQQSMLGVHQARFGRRVLEEGSIELIDVGKDGCGFDVGRVAQPLRWHAGGCQLVICQEGDGFDSAAEIAPISTLIRGAGKSACDPDYCHACGPGRGRHDCFLLIRRVSACCIAAARLSSVICESAPGNVALLYARTRSPMVRRLVNAAGLATGSTPNSTASSGPGNVRSSGFRPARAFDLPPRVNLDILPRRSSSTAQAFSCTRTSDLPHRDLCRRSLSSTNRIWLVMKSDYSKTNLRCIRRVL